jgi:hypothetical protein
MSVCVICHESFDRLLSNNDYLCQPCQCKHDANKEKADDADKLWQAACAIAPTLDWNKQGSDRALIAQCTLNYAKKLLEEYKRRCE